MSRDYPTLDEQYGPGAEQADAEAQDDIAAELQEAIDSPAEYSHRYWTEMATRAIEKLNRLSRSAERYTWLRDHWPEMTGLDWREPRGEKIDAYIDEKLAAADGGEKHEG